VPHSQSDIPAARKRALEATESLLELFSESSVTGQWNTDVVRSIHFHQGLLSKCRLDLLAFDDASIKSLDEMMGYIEVQWRANVFS